MQSIDKILKQLSSEQLNQIQNCTSTEEFQALIQENDSFGLTSKEVDQLSSVLSNKNGEFSEDDLSKVVGGFGVMCGLGFGHLGDPKG